MPLLIFGIVLMVLGAFITVDAAMTMRAQPTADPCFAFRTFPMPDGSTMSTSAFFKVNEYDPGPSEECFKGRPQVIMKPKAS